MKYNITSTVFLGYSHFGAITESNTGEIELSNEEVAILINLIKEKNSADVRKLNIQTTHPELYEKLDNVCNSLARRAEEEHWQGEGYDDVYCESPDYEIEIPETIIEMARQQIKQEKQ